MTEQAGPEAVGPAAFGRVESDGTVYVRTSAGERVVGQVPDVPAAEALGFFTRRFEALELEVSLLERRIATGALSPDDAVASITKVRSAVAEARAVGDLDGLQARLEALFPLIASQRAARKAERARQQQETRAAKEGFVLEAERLAAGNEEKDRHAHRKSVGNLLENYGPPAIGDLAVDLNATVDGPGVHDQDVRFRLS